MKELLLYINTLKKIIDRYYEKETVFYNNSEWYSREHSRNITDKELIDWVLQLVETIYNEDFN